MREKRRDDIVKMVMQYKMVKVTELLKRYSVSNETIRRDLEYLEEQGFLERVHGGAIAKTMYQIEPEYTNRKIKNYEQKQAIAKSALAFVEDGDAIIVDVGTTTYELAKLLINQKKITVFTNSLKIATLLCVDSNIQTILLGGNVRKGEISTSGFLAEEALKHFYVDKLFLGIGGISIEPGITDYHIEEAHLRQLYIAHARKVIALADYSKFETKAMNYICGIDEINTIITDKKTNSHLLKEVRDKGCQVVIAN